MNSTSRGISLLHLRLLSATIILCPFVLLPVKHSFVAPRQAFATFMGTIIVATAIGSGISTIKKSPLILPFILFNLVCFLSIFQAPHFFMGWKTFYLFFVLSSIALIVSISDVANKDSHLIFASILIPGVINAIYGCYQFFVGDFNFFSLMRFHIFGTLGSPAMLAGFMAISILSAIHLYNKTSSASLRIFLSATATLCSAVIILSRSRSGLAALLAGMAVYIFLSFLSRKQTSFSFSRIAVPVLMTILIAASIFFINPIDIKTRNTPSHIAPSQVIQTVKKASIKERFLLWNASADILRKSPLTGIGIGSYAFEYPLAQGEILQEYYKKGSGPQESAFSITQYAHNDYLQIATETGLPGLFSFLLFPATGFLFFLRSQKNRVPLQSTCAPVAAGIVVSTGVQAFFDFPLYMPSSALPAWICIGLLAATSGRDFEHREMKPLYRVPFFVSAIFLSFIAIAPLGSLITLEKAKAAIGEKDYPKAERLLSIAENLDPAQSDVYTTRGLLFRLDKNFYDSVEEFDRALKLSNHPTVFYGKGISAYLRGDNTTAADAFEKVLSIDPWSPRAQGALAVIYLEEGRIPESASLLGKHLEVFHSDRTSLKYMNKIMNW